MAEATHQMNSECRMALKNGDVPARIKNSFCSAVTTLNKEGFPFFNPSHFKLT
jgi:hypothetical protein